MEIKFFDEESCKNINKFNKCGQKNNKRNDYLEFVFKELFEDDLKKEANFIKAGKIKPLKESEL